VAQTISRKITIGQFINVDQKRSSRPKTGPLGTPDGTGAAVDSKTTGYLLLER